ncbi:MAG: ABC transporter permease [Aestuariivirga sp.]
MRALHHKLFRDVRRLWAQSLAIALVLAAGVATLILGVGAHDSLSETRASYYEANRFADVFASLTRAPKSVLANIRDIDGIAAAEGRIAATAIADLDGMQEPAAVRLVSLPVAGSPVINLLHLRSGRLPFAGASNEAVVTEGFALAHNLAPGDTFRVLINGRMRELRVSGTALSPEFIYVLGPGDLMPDERRFGVVWMPEAELAAAYGKTGAFSDLLVRLVPGTDADEVIAAIDVIIERYGGQGAYLRKDQISHAFLDAELKQLEAMSRILPPVFLAVAAFLVNMTLARLIALEREQIGLFKAMGFSAFEIAKHYLEFVALIAAGGVVIGFIAGTWLGYGLTILYADFFSFPFLIFRRNPDTYALAAVVALGAALAGGLKAVSGAVRLPPAVAMAPPAPARYRRTILTRVASLVKLGTAGIMAGRHLLHWPWRTASGILGIAFAVAILVGSLWSFGSIDYMIDATFFRADRQDVSITFTESRPLSAAFSAARLPGVMAAEPFRTISVKLRHGPVQRTVPLIGKPHGGDLSRVLNAGLEPQTLPESGIALSRALADILHAETGSILDVAIQEGNRRRVLAPVTAIYEGFFGLQAYMDIDALHRLLGEESQISGVHLTLDEGLSREFFSAVKATPVASFAVLQKTSLLKFRETLARNVFIMTSVYVSLSAIIAFGVVYNFARISLSEMGRELASLRVLGFTGAEVSALLYAELAVVILLAQPLGWLIGIGFAYAIVSGFDSELYRVPLVINRDVYAYASLTVVGAAILSALAVRKRIAELDLIAVLKTRE